MTNRPIENEGFRILEEFSCEAIPNPSALASTNPNVETDRPDKQAPPTSDLEARFDDAMMEIYIRAKNEAGYNATVYHQMLLNHRGLESARLLIFADQPSEGYTALWERDRLDLTVEALVLQPEWEPLFTQEPELLERARRRLADYGYNS